MCSQQIFASAPLEQPACGSIRRPIEKGRDLGRQAEGAKQIFGGYFTRIFDRRWLQNPPHSVRPTFFC